MCAAAPQTLRVAKSSRSGEKALPRAGVCNQECGAVGSVLAAGKSALIVVLGAEFIVETHIDRDTDSGQQQYTDAF